MYIYFEIHQVSHKEGETPNEKVLKNANELKHRPEKMNSSGIWGFTNATERRGGPDKGRVLFVNQYWIDTDIYDLEGKDWYNCQEYVKKIMFDLNHKRRCEN